MSDRVMGWWFRWGTVEAFITPLTVRGLTSDNSDPEFGTPDWDEAVFDFLTSGEFPDLDEDDARIVGEMTGDQFHELFTRAER